MRLATFNILHGRSPADGRVDIDRFAESIQVIDADVLALQEVDRNQPRSHFIDLTAVAATAMGARSYRFAPALAGTPGSAWVPALGTEPAGTATYGNALLSRYPVDRWQTLRMTALPARVPMRQPGRKGITLMREEPRVALLGRVDTPMGPVTAVAAHLAFVLGWSRVQLRRLVRQVADLPDPLVLMGDLNMTGEQASAISGHRSLGAAATFPAAHPVRQLDHVLLRGAAARVSTAHAVHLPVSDHRAFVVDIDDLEPLHGPP